MDLETATQIAHRYITELSTNSRLQLRLLSEQTLEREFGWVFFYGPVDEAVLVGGNAPLIVDRRDGSIHVTGTALPTETYLETYSRTGRTYPPAVLEHRVLLDSFEPNNTKASLIMAIRHANGKSVEEAAHCVNALLGGEPLCLTFPTAASADKFCSQAKQLGVVARRDTHYV